MEIWKDIKDYEDIYQVSNLGNVRRWRKKAKFWFNMSPINHSGGYKRLKLRNKGNDKDVYIHRLVADAFFIGQVGEVVNHIDGDKTNNNLSNLELTSQRENVTHGNKCAKNKIGVRYDKLKNRFTSRILIDGKRIYLGSFTCQTKAYFAYLRALKEYGLVNKYA